MHLAFEKKLFLRRQKKNNWFPVIVGASLPAPSDLLGSAIHLKFKWASKCNVRCRLRGVGWVGLLISVFSKGLDVCGGRGGLVGDCLWQWRPNSSFFLCLWCYFCESFWTILLCYSSVQPGHVTDSGGNCPISLHWSWKIITWLRIVSLFSSFNSWQDVRVAFFWTGFTLNENMYVKKKTIVIIGLIKMIRLDSLKCAVSQKRLERTKKKISRDPFTPLHYRVYHHHQLKLPPSISLQRSWKKPLLHLSQASAPQPAAAPS